MHLVLNRTGGCFACLSHREHPFIQRKIDIRQCDVLWLSRQAPPETEEYGVASFVYRERLPFVPEKILSVLNGDLPGVVRAKGHFWISTRPGWVAEFSLAGALSSIKPLGTWWASAPEDRWSDHEGARASMKEHWQEPWGDRRQEIVFIGVGIDWPVLEERLGACLVPETAAAGPETLSADPDPFPIWRRAEEAA